MPGSADGAARLAVAGTVEDIARRVYRAWNEGDVEELVALADPEAEWRPHLSSVAGETVRGPDGVRRLYQEMSQVWEVFRFEMEELHQVGDEEAVIFVRVVARGRGSGVETVLAPAHLMVTRNGRVWRQTTYTDRAEALRAAGLAHD